MQVDIKATGMELTDALRAFVQEKIDMLDAKTVRFGDVVRAEVEVGRTTAHHKNGEVYRAEIHVRLPGKVVYVESSDEDLYVAINQARKEAEREIIEYKDIHDSQKKGR
ncbi:MAG: ribosome-associated translation inhibitor RaiA [Patescibacteria group bacterium]|jgi:putative sigma-54 modulation protein